VRCPECGCGGPEARAVPCHDAVVDPERRRAAEPHRLDVDVEQQDGADDDLHRLAQAVPLPRADRAQRNARYDLAGDSARRRRVRTSSPSNESGILGLWGLPASGAWLSSESRMLIS